MTIRQSTLARQPADLLLRRLRDRDPHCTVTITELTRRGLSAEVNQILRQHVALAQEDNVIELQFRRQSSAGA